MPIPSTPPSLKCACYFFLFVRMSRCHVFSFSYLCALWHLAQDLKTSLGTQELSEAERFLFFFCFDGLWVFCWWCVWFCWGVFLFGRFCFPPTQGCFVWFFPEGFSVSPSVLLWWEKERKISKFLWVEKGKLNLVIVLWRDPVFLSLVCKKTFRFPWFFDKKAPPPQFLWLLIWCFS